MAEIGLNDVDGSCSSTGSVISGEKKISNGSPSVGLFTVNGREQVGSVGQQHVSDVNRAREGKRPGSTAGALITFDFEN